ncbi:MAG TPA: glycosyl transferase family 1 [Solibacterales bacterium]|nr:glycosyl transferase family 1 [Bryobacterales bacterium]
MRIALLGTRGIPARYGGFETFAEELSTRLAARGHTVTVYCRQRPDEPTFRGVRLVYLPTIRHKYFDTIAHTALSTLHLLAHRHDAVLYCNAANAVFTALPRALGMPVALNVDGLERKRKKWNWAARQWYLLSERLSTVCPNEIVSDAAAIREYYLERYRTPSTFIPYGAETAREETREALDRLGLEPGRYFLYVSRLEPENNALLVREAFERLNTDMKLAIIGDAPYAEEYILKLRDTSHARIVMPGGVYGQGYRELQSHCFAYIHATEVGGTHPALIEAMGRGALTLFLKTRENLEVAGGAALPFEHETLTQTLESVLAMPAEARTLWRLRAAARVEERYSWDRVTDQYEQLLISLRSGAQ